MSFNSLQAGICFLNAALEAEEFRKEAAKVSIPFKRDMLSELKQMKRNLQIN